MSHTDAPPAPAADPVTTPEEMPPVPGWDDDEPVVDEPEQTDQTDDTADDEPQPRRRRRTGAPIEPLVIGATNTTVIGATAAYQAAGPFGLAAAGATAVALAAGTVVQRRRTVRSRTTAAAGRPRSGATGSPWGRTRGGAAGGGAGRGAASGRGSGRGGAQTRGGAGRRGGSRGAAAGAQGGAAPRSPGRTRRGALASLMGRGAASGLAPRANTPRGAGRHRRRGQGGTTPSAANGAQRTPRRDRNRGARPGWVRPAASAARRGMAGAGRATGRTVRAAGRGIAAAVRHTARAGRRGVVSPVAAAWRRTANARRAAARGTGRAAGAVWDGALAGLAGLGSAVWHRGVRAGLRTLVAVWRRRRNRRVEQRTARGPAMTGPEIASTPAPVATTVRRPASAGGSPSTHGGTTMSGGHHFLAPAMEMERIAATYTPEGMMQVGRDFAALPDALEHVANAMRITTARADQEQPLDPRIVELMQNIYNLQIRAAELARELPGAFRQLHAVDIERLQNQRANEREWDVRANADTSL
ncbi:hypothetical protein [Streptomyces flaveolus]|uniref:hypothetical protein n=1 Tax=Streptomyces flaveolus TaxID=67297 RepID=UPI001670D4A3|nr:hypothetical protein [Streptomyces flaveolus]GGQ81159.1 hypothetical protein GCM10010216_48750 [Streptomyces flaveolus]